MTDLYRQCGVPVDPDFVRHLKQQLDVRRSANAAARSATQTAGPSAVRHTEVPIVLKPVKQPDHRGRWIALAAAIVAGVVGLGAVLVLVDRDDTELRPSDTRPTDTTAPTSVPSQPTVAPTVPASTLPASTLPAVEVPETPAAASADRQFAAAVAFTPDDWGPNYSVDPSTPRLRYARELAATVPECDPFLDTVFESPQRSATVTNAMGTTFMTANWEYVVVFPDVAGAEAMMASLHDPRFPDCFIGYSDYMWSWVGAYDEIDDFTLTEPANLEFAGDDAVAIDFIDPALNNAHMVTVFARSGRTVVMFTGEPEQELIDLVARGVAKVEAAEAGTPAEAEPLNLGNLAHFTLPARDDLLDRSIVDGAPVWQPVRSYADDVPACATLLDAFTNGSSTGVTHNSETLAIDPDDVVTAGGIVRVMTVAYRDDDAARRAIESIADAGFPDCLADYTKTERPNAFWTSIAREPAENPPSIHDDGSVWIELEGAYTAPDGTSQPTGRVVDVFVRVGPIVIGIDASMDHLTDAQLETFVDVMVERAQAALAGAPIPR